MDSKASTLVDVCPLRIIMREKKITKQKNYVHFGRQQKKKQIHYFTRTPDKQAHISSNFLILCLAAHFNHWSMYVLIFVFILTRNSCESVEMAWEAPVPHLINRYLKIFPRWTLHDTHTHTYIHTHLRSITFCFHLWWHRLATLFFLFPLVKYICVLPHLLGLVFVFVFHACQCWEKIPWIIRYGSFFYLDSPYLWLKLGFIMHKMDFAVCYWNLVFPINLYRITS